MLPVGPSFTFGTDGAPRLCVLASPVEMMANVVHVS